MLNILKNKTIKNKIIWIILFVSLLANFIGFSVIITAGIIHLKADLKKTVSLDASIIGEYSIQPLDLNARDEALNNILPSIERIPYVIAAHLYDKNDNFFTSYVKERAPDIELNLQSQNINEYVGSYLHTRLPLFKNNEFKGSIYLIASTNELNNDIFNLFLIMAALGTGITILTFYLAGHFQKIISQPVLRLASATEKVARERDYSVRVSKEAKDEIGVLYDGFNEIFESIEKRERDRKEAETALKNSEEKYRRIFSSIQEGIIIYDPESGKIIEANKSARELFGYGKNEILDIDITSLSAEPEKTKKVLDSARSGEIVKNSTVFLAKKKTGEPFIVELKIGKLKYQNKEVISTIIRDVTQKIQLEEEMNKIEKLKSLGLLAGGIAHDLNNFLQALGLNLFFAKESLADNHEVLPLIIKAEDIVLKSSALSKQLLTFSKGGAPIKEVTSIEDVVKDVCEFTLRGSKILLKYTSDADLSNCNCDKSQISQVLNNLVFNAIDVMKYGGELRVTLENYTIEHDAELPLAQGKYVKISIEDTGPGIEQRILHKVFDPFFTTKTKGSGLGLSTSFSIIRKHDGLLTAASPPGKGAIFTIYLPASDEEVVPMDDEALKEVVEPANILLMDDDSSIRTAAADALAACGHQVACTTNSRETVKIYADKLLEKDPFDLVILDLTIPGEMGGVETFRELQKLDPNVAAVISSGYSENLEVLNSKKYGFRAYLAKPYSLTDLNNIINRVLVKEENGQI